MKSSSKWRWQRHLLIAATVAVAVHVLSVLLIPRLVMNRVIETVAAEGAQPYWPPPIDHRHRRVVMPSPDLLYAVCAYDLADGPLQVSLQGSYPRYWSIAFYNANSDNFRTISADSVGLDGVDVTIDESQSTRTGLLLMRVLAGSDPEWLTQADEFRRLLRCEQ